MPKMNADTIWAVASFCDTETVLSLTSLDRHLLGAFVKERAALKRRQRFEEARRRVAEHVGELQHRVCICRGANVVRADYAIITRALTVVVQRYIQEISLWDRVNMLASVALFERFVGADNMCAISCNRGILYENGNAYPYNDPYWYSCTSAFLSEFMIVRGLELARALI